jgi:hypothetical protein
MPNNLPTEVQSGPPMNLLKNLLLTVMLTVVILATIAGCFIVAFMFFDGWWILAALIGEAAFFVLLAYLFRWWKYPGLYQAASARTLIGQYFGALLFFTGGVVVIALLAKLHLARIVNVESVSHRLGLGFQFRKGTQVQLSAVAPKEMRPLQLVVIDGYEVVARDNHRAVPEPVGTVFYKVKYADGLILDVPERELLSLD